MPIPPPGFGMPLPIMPTQGAVISGQPSVIRPPMPPSFPIVAPPTLIKPQVTSATLPLTLYIGKIPLGLEDNFIVRVLQECGVIQKWNRPQDAQKAYKAFGFVTFEQGKCALRCFNVCNGLTILEGSGESLQVKAGTKETTILEAIRTEERNDHEKLGFLSETEYDEEVRQKIARVIASLTEKHTASSTALSEADLEDFDTTLPVTATGGSESTAQAATAFGVNGLAIAPALAFPGGAGGALAMLPSEGDAEEEIEEKERPVQNEIEKFRVRQAARDKEVEAARKARLQARLKAFTALQASKRAEEETDALGDKLSRAREDADRRDRDSPRNSGDKRKVAEREEDKESVKRRKQAVLAMMRGGEMPEKESALEPSAVDLAAGPVKVDLKLGLSKPKAAKPKPAVSISTFEPKEDEANKPLRTIVPIDYSEEERLAGPAPSAAISAATAAINASAEEKRLQQKALVDKIPTEKAKLFAYDVDWDAVESADIVRTSMKPWVTKKMVEYLGEEEDTLTDFILTKLRARAPPQDILGELQAVLDEDADVFVVKLWRMLIFSSLKVVG